MIVGKEDRYADKTCEDDQSVVPVVPVPVREGWELEEDESVDDVAVICCSSSVIVGFRGIGCIRNGRCLVCDAGRTVVMPLDDDLAEAGNRQTYVWHQRSYDERHIAITDVFADRCLM